ncbi:hypothetical protein [Myroides odoratus]|uniref:hypothetical protein n=1 Tax=Myroides odoratus TaxID=256 RepID=UPI0039B02D68
MSQSDKGWFVELIQCFPELPGILMLLLGIVIWYWSIKGNEWMFDTGGPGIFSNITWVRNTFGEAIARRFNVLISWSIIASGIVFLILGVGLRIASMTGNK